MVVLSVLIPSIPERIDKALKLLNNITEQDQGGKVEVLLFTDNRQRSIGQKRDALVQIAKGKYMVFVDDDDDVGDTFVADILEAAKGSPDIITYKHRAYINGVSYTINSDLRNKKDEQLHSDGAKEIKRKPCHSNAIRTEIAQRHRFHDLNYGEDANWMKRVAKEVKTQQKINRILHFYIYNDHTTAADQTADAVNKGGKAVRGKIQTL